VAAEVLAHLNARDAQPLHTQEDPIAVQVRPGACRVA
jgi:hypothetical protein